MIRLGRAGIALGAALAGALLLWSTNADAARLKDLGAWAKLGDEQVMGIGLVVGLAGTGDTERVLHAMLPLASLLKKFEIVVDPREIRTKNIAVVTVTGRMPRFARLDATFDVKVSSFGNAKSLAGGTLLATVLRSVRSGKPQAIAAGPLTIGGYAAGAGGSTVTKNHPTAGTIPGGASVARDETLELPTLDALTYQLRTADFATAEKVATAMRTALGGTPESVRALDAQTVEIALAEGDRTRIPEIVAKLEVLEVAADAPARVILRESTGTVVLGGEVRIGAVAVAHGNLRVEIATTREASQPGPLSDGETVVVEKSEVKDEEQGGRLQVLKGSVTLQELVDALNALGATPRDLMDILQAIQAAGALYAEIVAE